MTDTFLVIWVKPGAKKENLAYDSAGRLILSVRSRAHDNQANEACIEFLSKFFSLPKRNIKLERGHKSRNKQFRLQGISSDQITTILKGALH